MLLYLQTRPDHRPLLGDAPRDGPRRGFTLVELLVVLTIALLLSILAIPPIVGAINHRTGREGASIIQAALAGARDQAARDNSPAGVRLLPDPTIPIGRLPGGQVDPAATLIYNRMIPLAMPPNYADGMAGIYPRDVYPTTVTSGLPVLVIEESPGYWQPILPPPATGPKYVFLPNSPASWAWNVRVGDRLQLGGSGQFYTVVGPTIAAVNDNPDLFTNIGLPGTKPLLSRTLPSPDGLQSVTALVEYLLLTNGRDDNGNGWTDEGWDGVDNNGNGLIDEASEWETEAWILPMLAADAPNAAYTIERRPAPMTATRELSLPSNIVVDVLRSRLPVNRLTGFVDILINPDGTVRPNTFYSSPASVPMNGGFLHFWLSERADLGTMPTGSWWLVTLFAKTGQITTVETPSLSDPFTPSQQGVR